MQSREFEIVVPPGKERERLDVFLAHHVENATRSKVQQAVLGGHVLVNGKAVRSSYRISPGEIIHVSIPKPPPPEVIAEDIPLAIVFEDEHLLVVNKPAGMVTHPAYSNYTGTLVNALLYHCRDRLSAMHEPARPGIVHRLDKDTSGLLVVAKDDAVHADLAKQFFRHTIEREYQAIVWGRFGGGDWSGVIQASLGRSKSDRKKFAVSSGGKDAVTGYETIEEFGYCSLVRLRLHTGRTHQIRVHLHHIGHPVFGDATYGGRRIASGATDRARRDEVRFLMSVMTRQALHAKTIGFVHPATKEFLRFDSDLPDDMRDLLLHLRNPVRV